MNIPIEKGILLNKFLIFLGGLNIIEAWSKDYMEAGKLCLAYKLKTNEHVPVSSFLIAHICFTNNIELVTDCNTYTKI